MRILRWLGRCWMWLLLATVLATAGLLALRAAMPLFAPAAPELLATNPAAAASEVAPRSQITLRFSQAMNRPSTERALQLDPPVPFTTSWDASNTTLTLSPTITLRPGSNYTLRANPGGLSRLFRPLPPFERSFRTAPAPAVVTLLPADGASDVAPTTPISIGFSRPMVPPSAVGQPTSLAALQFVPPLAGSVVWLDQATALFRPVAPLRPGTRYEATIDASLVDLAGIALGQPLSWGFSTPPVAVLAVSPADGAQNVAAQAPLVLRLSQPLDPPAVRAALIISPTVGGTLTASTLPAGTQVLTFTPAVAWLPETEYRITLGPGVLPGGSLPLTGPTTWRFSTAPAPRLIGRFPGEGQALPTGQSIRLIFSTAVDASALETQLRFSPPAANLRVSANGSEARITADLQAATPYTMTLPTTLTAANGAPLSQEYRLRFSTAAATPALLLPEANHRIVRLAPESAGLLLRRTNLTALNLDLYQLDEATLVRALGFGEDSWRSFDPNRYGQPLVRAWSVLLTDTLNLAAESRLPLLSGDGGQLPEGTYFLRIRTPEGPAADTLLLVSAGQLILQRVGPGIVGWASAAADGAPLAGVPVALYQDGALIERGTTDANGLWRTSSSASSRRPFLLLAASPAPAVVSSEWTIAGTTQPTPAENYRAFLTTDRAAYLPGEGVAIAGFVRVAAGLLNRQPAPGLRATLVVRAPGAQARIYETTVAPLGMGVVRGEFTLPDDATPGEYRVLLELGGRTFSTSFRVQARPTSDLRLAFTAQPPLPGSASLVTISTLAAGDLPVAGALISWTLRATIAPPPPLAGYQVGNPLAPPAAFSRSGSGASDALGQLTLTLSETASLTQPLRLWLQAQASEPGGPTAQGETTLVAQPTTAWVGVRLAGQVFTAGESRVVELLAASADGRPLPRADLAIEVLRRSYSGGGTRDERVLSRTLRADQQGRASLPLTLRNGGEYQLLASVSDDSGRRVPTAVSLYVAAAGFTGWQPTSDGQARLISDKPAYQPGDTATLLPLLPFETAEALITIRRGEAFSSTVRRIQAGDLLTVTLQPDDPPMLQASLVLLEVAQPTAPGPTSGSARVQVAGTSLPLLLPSRILTTTLTTDRPTYLPGATATITLTTRNASGAGVPADLLLAVVADDASRPRSPLDAFRPGLPPRLPTACFEAGEPALAGVAPTALPLAEPQATPGAVLFWNAALRTDANGVFSLQLPLPTSGGRYRVVAWVAAGDDQFGLAEAPLNIEPQIEARLALAPLLRAGDQVELTAYLRHSAAITQNLQLTLATPGLTLRDSTPLSRQVAVAPGTTVRAIWPLTVDATSQASVTLRLQNAAGLVVEERASRTITPAMQRDTSSSGGLVEDSYRQVISPTARLQAVDVAVAPSITALAADSATRLAAQPRRDTLDEAGLLLISAPLSPTQPLARAALGRLLAGESAGGAWGWQPGGPPDPFMVAVALEALAEARQAGLAVPEAAVEQGLAALRATIGTNAPPLLLAHTQYLLARFGRPEPAALDTLASQPAALGPESLARLLLARPPDTERDRALLERLASLAQRTETGVFWPAETGPGLHTSATATALATLALQRHTPNNSLLPAAQGWLAATLASQPPSGYQQALLLAALGTFGPATASGFQISLADQELLRAPSASHPLSSTAHLSIPVTRLVPGSSLVVSATGQVFVQVTRRAAADTAPQAGQIGLLREYLSPASEQVRDPATLRPGELVRVRLTVVVRQPLSYVQIDEPLPGGAALVTTTADGFTPVVTAEGLTLARTSLLPGSYQAEYLLRVLTPGTYQVPPPSAYELVNGLIGRGIATQMVVGLPSN